MGTRAWTWWVWVGVGASAAAWALPWWPSAQPSQPVTVVSAQVAVPPAAWGLLFGDAGAAPALAAPSADASRFTVLGLIGPREPQAGSTAVVVLSVDGKPPRAYRVGQSVDNTWLIRSISPQGVELATSAVGPTIRLPVPVWTASAAGATAPPALPPDQGIQMAAPPGTALAPALAPTVAPAFGAQAQPAAVDASADGAQYPMTAAQQTDAARARSDELRARLAERRRGGASRDP